MNVGVRAIGLVLLQRRSSLAPDSDPIRTPFRDPEKVSAFKSESLSDLARNPVRIELESVSELKSDSLSDLARNTQARGRISQITNGHGSPRSARTVICIATTKPKSRVPSERHEKLSNAAHAPSTVTNTSLNLSRRFRLRSRVNSSVNPKGISPRSPGLRGQSSG